MDTLKLSCAWGKAALVPGAKITATITGLTLEGCLFDGSRLSAAERSSQRHVTTLKHV